MWQLKLVKKILEELSRRSRVAECVNLLIGKQERDHLELVHEVVLKWLCQKFDVLQNNRGSPAWDCPQDIDAVARRAQAGN